MLSFQDPEAGMPSSGPRTFIWFKSWDYTWDSARFLSCVQDQAPGKEHQGYTRGDSTSHIRIFAENTQIWTEITLTHSKISKFTLIYTYFSRRLGMSLQNISWGSKCFCFIYTHDKFYPILRTYGLDTADLRIFLIFYVPDDRFHVSVISDRLSDSVTQWMFSLLYKLASPHMLSPFSHAINGTLFS